MDYANEFPNFWKDLGKKLKTVVVVAICVQNKMRKRRNGLQDCNLCYIFAAVNQHINFELTMETRTVKRQQHVHARVTSAWKVWTTGNRKKPETQVMRTDIFLSKLKDGTL